MKAEARAGQTLEEAGAPFLGLQGVALPTRGLRILLLDRENQALFQAHRLWGFVRVAPGHSDPSQTPSKERPLFPLRGGDSWAWGGLPSQWGRKALCSWLAGTREAA